MVYPYEINTKPFSVGRFFFKAFFTYLLITFFAQKPIGRLAISPVFDAGGNKNIGATIRIGLEIGCLPYAGFFTKYIG